MTKARISYNCNAAALDPNALKSHVTALNPVALLIMDGMGLAAEIARLLPECIVIHRDYTSYNGDDDLPLKISPGQWVNSEVAKGNLNIWRYCCNEVAFDQHNLDWMSSVIAQAVPRGLKLVIGGWAVGNPTPEAWPMAREFLTLVSQNRATVIVNLHEYFAGCPTSGYYGGYPDNAGVPPGQSGGQNLVPSSAWPANISGITMWHCGRFKFMVDYCKSISLQPPRLIMTEAGADDVSDIKQWLQTLVKTPPYDSIRGWKTLREQWKIWYPQWSFDRAYFEMLSYLDDIVYQNTCVEAELIFTWSDNPTWESFNVAHATEFQGYMLQQQASNPIPPDPPDFDYGAMVLSTIDITNPNFDTLNLRSTPDLLHQPIEYVHDGEQVEYSENGSFADNYEWRKTKRIETGTTGYLAKTSSYTVTPVKTAKYAVIVRIPGLTAEQAAQLVNNVEVSVENDTE